MCRFNLNHLSNPRSQTPVILGRLFLATANAIINCRNGSMRLTFGDMTKEVNVFNLGKQPRDMDDQTFEVNSIENLTSEHEESIEPDTESEFDLKSEDFNLDQIIESAVDWASSPNVPIPKSEHQILPSNESTSSLELKALPEHLKYADLGGKKILPVIISSHLTGEQEESLMFVLRKHREAIGWTMNNIKGISPAIVQHRIHLNDDATPKRDPQRKLNPFMQDAV